jgi:hypothetical protein
MSSIATDFKATQSPSLRDVNRLTEGVIAGYIHALAHGTGRGAASRPAAQVLAVAAPSPATQATEEPAPSPATQATETAAPSPATQATETAAPNPTARAAAEPAPSPLTQAPERTRVVLDLTFSDPRRPRGRSRRPRCRQSVAPAAAR